MRGPGPALRILKILDPVTQELVAYTIAGGFGRADRVVWMDGRPHPSDFSEHTWDGFSTGVWENGQLVVTTTHMKQGVIQRNGSATSPYGKMVEHFFRHGEIMTMVSSVDDPIYLEEPMVRSHTWRLNTNGNMGFGNAFESVDELGDKPLGWVPFYPLGVTHPEFAEKVGLPFAATRGGKESLYPEYQLKIQEMVKRKPPARPLRPRRRTLRTRSPRRSRCAANENPDTDDVAHRGVRGRRADRAPWRAAGAAASADSAADLPGARRHAEDRRQARRDQGGCAS